MSDNPRRSASEVRPIAERILARLQPYTERLVIAGSLRRGSPDVKDVELVGIAKPGLLDFMDELVGKGVISKALYGEKKPTFRWGNLYRGFEFESVRFELFLGDTDNYGCVLKSRTGSGEANEYLMSHLIASRAPYRFRGGYFWQGQNWRRVKDKWVGDNEQRLSVPDEPTLYCLLGMPYIDPAERTEVTYRKLLTAPDHRWGAPPEIPVAPKQLGLPGFVMADLEMTWQKKVSQPTPPLTPFVWERPWLRGDGRVIIWHAGRWVLADPTHLAAEAYRQRLGRMGFMLRAAEAYDLQRWLLVQWAAIEHHRAEQERSREVERIIQEAVMMLREEAVYA